MVQVVSFTKTDAKFEEYAAKGIEKQIKAGNMTQRDKELIYEYVDILRSENGISHVRAYKVINTLSNVTRFIQKPFLEVTIADLRAACNRIKDAEKTPSLHAKKESGRKLTANTQRDYISFIKRFFLWMVDEGYVDMPVEKIRKIKPPHADKCTKTAAMMLSDDDIRKLLAACTGKTAIRDKAVISIMYEGALRIHEAALLKWGDLDFSDKRFVSLNTAGKTGKPRYVPLPASRGYLAAWKGVYPEEITEDKPVFITGNGKSFTYPYLKLLLKRITERAGVKSFVPHTLRHSRITNLARSGVSEISIKQLAWGDVGSNMFSTYAHLVNTDLDREILKASGMEPDAKKIIEPLKPKACPRCYHVNSPEKSICEVCGCPLDEETTLELDDMKAEIHADNYYQNMIMNLTAQLKALKSLINQDPNVNLTNSNQRNVLPGPEHLPRDYQKLARMVVKNTD